LTTMKRALSLALLGCAWSAAPNLAHAGFNQAMCSATGWDTAVPMDLGARQFIRQSIYPAAGSAPDMTLYNHNVDNEWPLVTNANVSLLRPYFGFFVTELNYDKLTVFDGSATYTYTGSLNTSTTPLAAAQNWSLANRAISTRWVADFSVANQLPPSFSQVTPRCKSTQTASVPPSLAIGSNRRIDGLLIKTGDTIYFNVVQDSRPFVITLDGLSTTSGADFDLYVSATNTAPDDSSYDFRGFTTGSNEALLIPASGVNRTLYIGVHSYSGAGHFALNAASTYSTLSSVCATDPTLSSRVTLTAAERATLQANLRAASSYLFASTNGMWFRSVYQLNTTWTGACTSANGCDICVVNDSVGGTTARSIPGTPCGFTEYHGGDWRAGAAGGWVLAHESGHSCLGLGDRYQNNPTLANYGMRYDGHTLMANNALAPGYAALGSCLDGQGFGSDCTTLTTKEWTHLKSWMGTLYRGPDLSAGDKTQAAATSMYNAQLQSLVTTIGF
ncbi:MAG TPA: hypothetical protein VJR89_10590, partial [Polyangiales bacterium]|nr:hypothetical protein [Polyangiales bacterium]